MNKFKKRPIGSPKHKRKKASINPISKTEIMARKKGNKFKKRPIGSPKHKRKKASINPKQKSFIRI